METNTLNHFQTGGASRIQINQATSYTACARATLWRDQKRQIVAVHKADIIEIHATGSIQCKLRQCSWRCGPAARALHGTRAAITCGTCELAGGGVRCAERAAP